MNRTHQNKRDSKWAQLHSNEHKTIDEIAKIAGYHRNTVSRGISKINKAAHVHQEKERLGARR